jgi:type II secretory pathway pseudopilin PulG
MNRAHAGGYSLLDLLAAMAISVTVGAVAIPQYLTMVDEVRASGAAYHISSRLQRARMEAVLRSAAVGIQFTQTGSGFTYTVYVDGNRNGILTRDIQRGVDRLIALAERLPDQFAGVEFGAIPGLPAVDPGGTAPGTDPIRLGSGSIVTFSAMGTSSSGTVYIRSRRGAQFAVRMFGETGKTRILKFEPRTGQWRQL